MDGGSFYKVEIKKIDEELKRKFDQFYSTFPYKEKTDIQVLENYEILTEYKSKEWFDRWYSGEFKQRINGELHDYYSLGTIKEGYFVAWKTSKNNFNNTLKTLKKWEKMEKRRVFWNKHKILFFSIFVFSFILLIELSLDFKKKQIQEETAKTMLGGFIKK